MGEAHARGRAAARGRRRSRSGRAGQQPRSSGPARGSVRASGLARVHVLESQSRPPRPANAAGSPSVSGCRTMPSICSRGASSAPRQARQACRPSPSTGRARRRGANGSSCASSAERNAQRPGSSRRGHGRELDDVERARLRRRYQPRPVAAGAHHVARRGADEAAVRFRAAPRSSVTVGNASIGRPAREQTYPVSETEAARLHSGICLWLYSNHGQGHDLHARRSARAHRPRGRAPAQQPQRSVPGGGAPGARLARSCRARCRGCACSSCAGRCRSVRVRRPRARRAGRTPCRCVTSSSTRTSSSSGFTRRARRRSRRRARCSTRIASAGSPCRCSTSRPTRSGTR